ncbi:transcription factor MYBS3-like [Zingiber officinale]|uniref:MYB protein n=1 Tax=Zingiber officinale TaxID=94328 RepID=A0AA50CAN4_ZINOF|nr:transcription factor MYBS3-like [Zingiber officinale]WLQ69492.1 MYB protein [Zingiber officinale]
MTRRCSHCGNNGHNSRTCPARGGGVGVRIFGVRLTEGVGAMKKSASMGCLSSSITLSNAGASPSAEPTGEHPADSVAGYASDDAHATSSSICRKKGVPWTEEEHRMFLLGLQKLGKGDWRGIARNFVISRTPTQVASHAQKYFIRQSNASRRKRRSSLFDMPIEQIPVHEEHSRPHSPPNEPDNTNRLAMLHGSEQQGTNLLEASATKYVPELTESIHPDQNSIAMIPAIYTAFIPVQLPFWTPNLTAVSKEEAMRDSHEIVKPIPVVPKEALNIEEVVGMSKLSIGDSMDYAPDPSALSLKLVGSSTSRQSAFHANSSVALPDLNQSSGSPIHAV